MGFVEFGKVVTEEELDIFRRPIVCVQRNTCEAISNTTVVKSCRYIVLFAAGDEKNERERAALGCVEDDVEYLSLCAVHAFVKAIDNDESRKWRLLRYTRFI